MNKKYAVVSGNTISGGLAYTIFEVKVKDEDEWLVGKKVTSGYFRLKPNSILTRVPFLLDSKKEAAEHLLGLIYLHSSGENKKINLKDVTPKNSLDHIFRTGFSGIKDFPGIIEETMEILNNEV
jgi:hypothetical protein